MPIVTFPIGPLDTNCHVVYRDGDALVVDPGGDLSNGLNDVQAFLAAHSLTLRAILLTHIHFDHIYGVADLLATHVDVVVHVGADDIPLLDSSVGRGSIWGLPPVTPFSPQAIPAGSCSFGAIQGEIRLTPGHSPGGLVLWLPEENAVIAGDTLFYRSVGRTDLPGGDSDALRTSIVDQLFSLPETTVVYTGHGPDTTIGAEKKANPYISF